MTKKAALVTGAAQGIGQAIAVRLATEGYHVAIADMRPADETTRLMAAAGGEVFSITADLASPGAPAEVAQAAIGRFERCDILVNCAGQVPIMPFGEIDLGTWRRAQAVNVEAPFQLCAALVPGMAARGFGRIINVASNTFWKPPGPGFVAYVTTKGALIGFTRALAVELGGHGITVNAIAPGLTRTPGAQAGNQTSHFEEVRLLQAIKRTTEPADLAAAVAYLASADAAMVTGQTLCIDGGLVTL
jgi:NAD(P)-dependent dehydrogenase (short-subunit alcohol dehydrogenase family)